MKTRRVATSAFLAALLLGGLLHLGFRLVRASLSAPAQGGTTPAERFEALGREPDSETVDAFVVAPLEPPSAVENSATTAGAPDPQSGVVTGVILDRYGAPVSGARVEAARAEARSDQQGEFILEGIPGGAHALMVSRAGFARAVVPGVEPESDLAITLARLGGVSGQVVDAGTGVAVDDFRLRVSGAGSAARERHFAASGGSFAVGDLPPGSYVLEAAARGRSSDPVKLEIDDDQVIEGLEIPIAFQEPVEEVRLK